MKEKKYIDRLYQEKFRDFEATPRNAVWTSIAEKLQQEEKRRPVIAPLWSRLAGVAAIFTFLLLIGEWILPVQRGTTVVREDFNERPSPSSVSPLDTQMAVVPSDPEPDTKLQYITGSKSIAEASTEVEERKQVQVSSLKIASKSAIFESSTPVAAIPHQKEKAPTANNAEKRSILEAIAEKEEEVEIAANTSRNRFEVSSHAAPIYYGNLGKGNFLDPRFDNNSSEGEITYSYGVNIAYNLSDKIKIRSGVNKVNMTYNTEGVAYQSVAGSVPVRSVSLKSGSTVTNSTGDKMAGRQPTGGTLRNPAGFLTPGNLKQEMGFIEVPLELEYNIFAKKLELNLIGGASTLFLDENQISLNSASVSAEGRANNINNISFSTNIGFGVDYNLSKRFKLNFEPMLKYQLNTFESPSEDTKPYYLGVYSGFSYKF